MAVTHSVPTFFTLSLSNQPNVFPPNSGFAPLAVKTPTTGINHQIFAGRCNSLIVNTSGRGQKLSFPWYPSNDFCPMVCYQKLCCCFRLIEGPLSPAHVS